jgi:hypothetical protein
MSSTRSTPVEMIANGDELFAEEEHALLLVRLRAVAFLLSAGLTLVLVREELFGGGPGWPLQAAAMVAMMFLATLLRAARSGWERGLKVVEAAAFGLAAGVVPVHLWHAQLSGTARGGVEGRGDRHDDCAVHLRPADPRWKRSSPPARRPTTGMPGRRPVGGRSSSRRRRLLRP